MNVTKTTMYTIEMSSLEKQYLTEALYEVYATITDPLCTYNGQHLNWRSDPAKLNDLWSKLASAHE